MLQDVPGNGAIHRPGVYIIKTETAGELSSHTAFSRSSWSIDRDNTMSIFSFGILLHFTILPRVGFLARGRPESKRDAPQRSTLLPEPLAQASQSPAC